MTSNFTKSHYQVYALKTSQSNRSTIGPNPSSVPLDLWRIFSPTSSCIQFPCYSNVSPSFLGTPSTMIFPSYKTSLCLLKCRVVWASKTVVHVPPQTISTLSSFPAIRIAAQHRGPPTASPMLGPGSTNLMVPSPWSQVSTASSRIRR